ncbi:MAG: pantoate--beta-alanine ligase [Bacteroidota bacterium]|nr:pantoate--beta-alanine ligase [Bacteroidota bacterium]
MIICSTLSELQKHLKSVRELKLKIGFVPTMGALHPGHMSLIQAAKKECDVVVCSIFVNPTQFNDPRDLEKYPRTLEKDAQLLQAAGCDLIFAPEVTEMYSPAEIEQKRLNLEDKTWTEGLHVDFGSLDKVMEGAHRQGHFNGVAQVVSKLFRMVKPHKSYFGQKDFQQLAIIKSMVKQLGLDTEVVSCPIMREADGLAMSSRNTRLSPAEREKAPVIYKILHEASKMQDSASAEEIRAFVDSQFKLHPEFNLEYFEISDAETLLPLKDLKSAKSAVACIAVKLGELRLIDNILLYS